MPDTKEKKRKNSSGTLWKLLFAVAVITLVFSGFQIIRYFWVGHVNQANFDALKVKDGRNVAELQKQNRDLVGWLTVPGTKIDYPVMQTPNENEYYLRRNFKKESSVAGTPFMDAGSVIGQSKNYLIFGHNMKNGTMFHDLMRFDEKEFWGKHKTLTFDMADGKHKFRVVAAFYSKIYAQDDKVFKYYQCMSITDSSAYDSYIRNAKALSEYDTGVDPQYGQQLITLSTCAYQTEDGRFAVVAAEVK